MPTYDYECSRCGHTFEEFQSITARPRSRCPQCRGKVQRLIGAGAGIVFKGSGFYVTDSRKARPSTGTKKIDTTGSSSSSTADTKTKKSAPKEKVGAGQD